MAIKGDLYKIISSLGYNDSGLGRWNWVDLTLESTRVRMITAYRCVVSKQTNNIVYQQQLRYFRKIERNIYPIKAFIADLYNFIK